MITCAFNFGKEPSNHSSEFPLNISTAGNSLFQCSRWSCLVFLCCCQGTDLLFKILSLLVCTVKANTLRRCYFPKNKTKFCVKELRPQRALKHGSHNGIGFFFLLVCGGVFLFVLNQRFGGSIFHLLVWWCWHCPQIHRNVSSWWFVWLNGGWLCKHWKHSHA